MIEACKGRHSYNVHLNFKGNDKQKMSLLTHIYYSQCESNISGKQRLSRDF